MATHWFRMEFVMADRPRTNSLIRAAQECDGGVRRRASDAAETLITGLPTNSRRTDGDRLNGRHCVSGK